MNPRNSIWRDVPALNDYVARCQSILQSGKPDNDMLLYWPIYDFWNARRPTVLPQLQVERSRSGLKTSPSAKRRTNCGIAATPSTTFPTGNCKRQKSMDGKIQMPGGNYKVIVVPECKYMPLETFKQLLALADNPARR